MTLPGRIRSLRLVPSGARAVAPVAVSVAVSVAALIALLVVTPGGAVQVPAGPPLTRVEGHPAGVDGGLSRGAAWGDIDGDGDADLIVANALGQIQHLYRNDGRKGFTQLHEEPPVMDGGRSEGVSFADYDGDGDLDILVTNQFDEPLRVYENLGDAEDSSPTRFVPVRAGALGDDTPYSATSACWADYDLDGLLDVFVVNRDGRDDLLFHNVGEGSFVLAADPAGSSGGDGRACAWGDVDDDGDPDLYVGNFRGDEGKAHNFLFINEDGHFRREDAGAPVVDRNATYGVSFVDTDGDGDLDLFVSNISLTDHNILYVNDGHGSFTELAADPIETGGRPSKGHTWGDFDLDGDLDVAIATGTEADVDLRNYLYLNDGSGHFAAVESGRFVEDVDTSASVTWADPDLDGDLDLYVTNWGGNDQDNAFYRNDVTGRHWIAFTLEGTRSNRMGIGARVRVQARVGGALRWQDRWLWPATGYASQNEPVIHFGLGDAARVERVEVHWPSGIVDRITGMDADQRVHLVERGEADPPAASQEPRTRVVVLGTGNPNADPERSGPAVAVLIDDRSYIVDAGAGVVRRAAWAAREHGIAALQPERLERVFLTHLHSDHTLGLPDILLTPFVLDRPGPLDVYGPPGTKRMMDLIGEAWSEDIAIRIDGLEPHENNPDAFRSTVHEVMPGLVYEDDLVRVYAAAMPHGSWEYSYAYRFEGPDRTIVISGDTGPSEAIVELCNGCDILLHEAYSSERFETRPPEWKRYHSVFHTSTTDVADLATRARPGLLVLYHQIYWGADDATLLSEMRAAGYEGPLRSARDLDIF